MRQKQIRTVKYALNRASLVRSGIEKHGSAIGFKHSDAEMIAAGEVALSNADKLHLQERVELSKRRKALQALVPECVAFAGLAREFLKAHLGRKYSGNWIPVGFKGSLELPRTVPGLKPLLEQMASYFKLYPATQVAGAEITSARAKELYKQLIAAQGAVLAQLTVVRQALADRNKKFRILTKRLSNVGAELRMLVEPTDTRYLAFGLKMPGAKSVPEVPTNLVVKPHGPNAVSVSWDRSARAEHYRGWLKIKGQHEEAVSVGSRNDLDFAFENLPTDVEVELGISAVNSGGESQRATIVVTIPPGGNPMP